MQNIQEMKATVHLYITIKTNIHLIID